MRRSLPILARAAVPMEMPARPAGFGERELPLLRDSRDRAYTYLRLSLTDRCNMACVYCMPPSGENDHALRPEILEFEEIVRLVGVMAQMGVRRVRFTGGEPLVRKDVVRLVELVSERTQAHELVMTTNGDRLPELAAPLARAGLHGVNISIDSLDADRFREITRGGELSLVLAGIHAAIDAGLEVKLNAVLLGGINDDEAGALVDFAWSLGIVPRFIELMPLGEAASLPKERFIDARAITALLGERVDRAVDDRATDRGPARYVRARDGGDRKVGFITAMSDEFCASCNRIRITARGDVRACLADRKAISLRDVMRAGGSDADLAWAIHWALGAKDAGHHFRDADVHEHENVGMSLVGG
jgi:cyclic pyranopterin phosphate synthase